MTIIPLNIAQLPRCRGQILSTLSEWPLHSHFRFFSLFSSRLISAHYTQTKFVVKVNLTIITKNHAADPEIGFLTKSISKPYGRATAMPPA